MEQSFVVVELATQSVHLSQIFGREFLALGFAALAFHDRPPD